MFNIFKGNKQFVSDNEYRKNLAAQLNLSPQTVAQLREYGVTENTKLKLEYFFYTDKPEKAVSLAQSLENLGYSVEYGESVNDNKLQIITGWTAPITVETGIVLEWTEYMCKLGYEYDCDFDGWGTNPE